MLGVVKRFVQLSITFLSLIFFAVSCGVSSDTSNVASGALTQREAQKLELVSGDNQTAIIGTTLAPMTVKLTSLANDPVANELVFFSVEGNVGTLGSTTAITDNDGVASTVLTLGSRSGVGQVIVKGISSDPVPVVFNALPGDPFAILADPVPLYATDNPVLPTVNVRVVDNFFNPIVGETVNFSVNTAGIRFIADDIVTDTQGYAHVAITEITATVGSYVIQAWLKNHPSSLRQQIQFGIAPGAPFNIKFSTTHNATSDYCRHARTIAPAGASVGNLVVEITDRLNRPVPNIQVDFAPNNTTYLSPTENFDLTDANGKAGTTVQVDPSTPIGSHQLNATIHGTTMRDACILAIQ